MNQDFAPIEYPADWPAQPTAEELADYYESTTHVDSVHGEPS